MRLSLGKYNPNAPYKLRKDFKYNDSGIPRLLPEYIYGYIPSDKNGNYR